MQYGGFGECVKGDLELIGGSTKRCTVAELMALGMETPSLHRLSSAGSTALHCIGRHHVSIPSCKARHRLLRQHPQYSRPHEAKSLRRARARTVCDLFIPVRLLDADDRRATDRLSDILFEIAPCRNECAPKHSSSSRRCTATRGLHRSRTDVSWEAKAEVFSATSGLDE